MSVISQERVYAQSMLVLVTGIGVFRVDAVIVN